MLDSYLIKINCKRFAFIAFFTLLSMSIISISPKVQAQAQEEIDRLTQELELERLRTDIEEEQRDRALARQERAAAAFPQLPSNAPDGTISADAIQFESTLLAYQAMEVVAGQVRDEIIANVLESKFALILIEDESTSQIGLDQIAAKSFKKQYDEIVKDASELLGRDPASLTGTATTSFLFNLLPFFRTDRKFTNVEVSISDRAFAAALAFQFRAPEESNRADVLVYYPSESAVISEIALEDISGKLSSLETIQRELQEEFRSLPPDGDTSITDVQKTRKAELSNLINSITNLMTSIMAVDAGGNDSLFSSIVRSLTLELMEADGRQIYYMSVNVVAGGTNRTSRNFLSNRLRHSGGAILEYIVYDSTTGAILFSNIVDNYTGFTQVPNSN